MNYIGIDLGTSSVKLLLTSGEGRILKTVSKSYPLSFPRPGWSEQDPADWIAGVKSGIRELIAETDASAIAGIGCGGQMHGLVVLDENGRVIRPAILWNDGRTSAQTDYLNETVGKEKLTDCTANIAFAGFTAPKLLWMRENEPELFARIRRIMLPKDYVNYVLTGVHCTDASDASGMLLFDVEHRCWSEEMLEICGIRTEQLPRVFESSEAVGCLLPAVAEELGLPAGVTVCAGAGDNAAAAVGTGTVGNNACNISLGTSGTVFISSEKFRKNNNPAVHLFAHADGSWHLMGCMLSAASCSKWMIEDVLKSGSYDEEFAAIDPGRLGKNSVYFLPYLMGERSPINDTDARGAFIGMSMDSSRADLLQAVWEGVAFGIRDSLEVARALGLDIRKSRICGGGAKNALVRKIVANVCGLELERITAEEGPGFGAAMLAMVACGEYPDVKSAAERFVRVKDTEIPDPELVALYEKRYASWKKLYPALKELFPELAG